MNNNQVNFDPMTGQPINQGFNGVSNAQVTPQQQANNIPNVVPPIQPQPPMQQVNVANNTNPASIQQQMNSIPTVDQDKKEFITNTQATTEVKTETKKNGPNIAFIVILFIIIFASIFFLFPYLLDLLG